MFFAGVFLADYVSKILRLKWFPAAVALVMVLLTLTIFCWPVMFGGRTLFHTHTNFPPSDEMSVHLPLHAEVGRQVRQGDFPLFNSYPAFGMPLAADSDALVFDPFMAVFRSAGPATEVLSWRSIVMGVAGAMAIFGLLWLFGVSIIGSVAGAVVYTSLVLRYPTAEELLIHYVGTDWSVIGLFFLAYAIRARKTWAFPLAGLATGLSAFSGHPQAAYFGFAMGILYIIGEAWPRPGGRTRHVLVNGAGWLAVALAVAAVQLVPLAASIQSSLHVFSDPSHPECDENLIGYALTILGPAVAVLFILPTRRRWIEAWAFILLTLFVLTILNTPIIRFWHQMIPFFDYFKLSSKYFVSPFPVLASIGLGLGIGIICNWEGTYGRIGLFVAVVCTFYPVWGAPLSTVYQLQQPSAVVEKLDASCLEDIRSATPDFGRLLRYRTEAMYPSLTVTAGIFDVQVSASSLEPRFAELMMMATPEHARWIKRDSKVRSVTDPAVLDLPFWDVAGVTTLLSGEPVDLPGWEPVVARPDSRCMTNAAGYWIYWNPDAMPRAFLTSGPATPDDDVKCLQFVLNPDVVPPVKVPGDVDISHYSGSRVVIDVNATVPADLVLTDSMLDGWRVGRWETGRSGKNLVPVQVGRGSGREASGCLGISSGACPDRSGCRPGRHHCSDRMACYSSFFAAIKAKETSWSRFIIIPRF